MMVFDASELRLVPGHRVLCDDVDVTGLIAAVDPDEGWVEFDMPAGPPRRVRFYGKVLVIKVRLVYLCQACRRPFDSAGALLAHLRTPHLSAN